MTDQQTDEFTTDDILRAIGRELTKIRAMTAVAAGVALLQAVLLAVWILGLITIQFEPVGF